MKRDQTLTGIDFVLEALQRLEMQSDMTSVMKGQIHTLQPELRFLKMFSLCLKNCVEAGKDFDLGSVMINLEPVFKEAEQGVTDNKVEDLDPLACALLENVERLKLEIREVCAVLFNCSFKSKSCTSDEILEIMDTLLRNLKDLVDSKVDVTVPVKNQIKVLAEKISILRNLVDFVAKRCIEHQKLEDFLDYMQGWVNKAASLSLVYWLETEDQTMAPVLETMIFDLIRMIKPYTPEVTRMCVGVLKASNPSASDKLLTGQIVASFVDFLLEDLVVSMKDNIQFLRDGLVFLITFLMSPPEEFKREAESVLLTQIDILIGEVFSLIFSLYMDEIEGDICAEREISQSGIQDKLNLVEAEIRETYVHVPGSSYSNFPMTNAVGFVEFLSGYLKEMLKSKDTCIPFAKLKVETAQEELVSLLHFLKGPIDLKREHEELKEICKRIITVAYQAEHVIESCSVIDSPIWYDMICLSDVIEEMKLIQIEVNKSKDHPTHNTKMFCDEMNSSGNLPAQAIPSTMDVSFKDEASTMDGVVVGFKDEAEKIIDELTRGSKQLQIISIVGMPGIGKTTLAKKVYYDPSVESHFYTRAWCCVSQVYKIRELFLDILTHLTGDNARVSNCNRSDDELPEQLRKCLKRRRYLIVMDDIWDIGAWKNIKWSLPDDHNGSRVLFTSRIHDLASQAQPICNRHHLRPFSVEESWNLLQVKLFHKYDCPQDLADVGKKIAKNCKGLPLAIVLVAGILARNKSSPDWWQQIESSTAAHIASEGCMDILELSYKHLPERLRPCFLYFGAFPEDRIIRVPKLIKLWIAEGFIERRLYDVAEEILRDLIGRSLVIVAERSSSGGIKACGVHDLVRDLCLSKVKEEEFLQWVHGRDIAYYSLNRKEYDQYRLCIDGEWTQFMDSRPIGPHSHSLLLFGDYSRFVEYSLPSSFLNSFKLLKVLDLECIYLDTSFPEETILIIHLRYLAIWCLAKHLPSSIANLWNLETFVLKSGLFICFPSFIFCMKSLRHLHINSTFSIEYKDDESTLFESNVETLSTPFLDYGRATDKLLRGLPRLRKLKCKFPHPEIPRKPLIQFPRLSSLNELESLQISSNWGGLFREMVDQFPCFDLPSGLRKLTLRNTRLPWSSISPIGQLPNLEVLKLRNLSFSGKSWDTKDGEFSNLKFLELYLLDIEKWNVATNDHFPCLEQLVLKWCDSLEEIPSSLGEIFTLKKIEVSCCDKAAISARKILEEQKDMGNDSLEVNIMFRWSSDTEG